MGNSRLYKRPKDERRREKKGSVSFTRGDINMDRKKELETKELTGGIQTSSGRLCAPSAVIRRGSTLLVLLVVIVIGLIIYFIFY